MIDKLIHWWTNYMPFHDDELQLADKLESKDIDYSVRASEDTYLIYQNTLLDMMPWTKILNSPKVSFASSCTDLIDALFLDYVNDDTLVITTSLEHNSVRENLKKCKNVIELDYATATLKNLKLKEFVLSRMQQKSYSNVFIYIVGTFVAYRNIHSNEMIKRVQSIAKSIAGNNVTTVLDDCQGMFLVPRDYSLFDYVLGTSHAITRMDSGILLRTDLNLKDYGVKSINALKELIIRLDPVVKRREKLMFFNNVMTHFFDRYRSMFDIIEESNLATHIFSVIDKNRLIDDSILEALKKYGIRIDGEHSDNNGQHVLRFRAMHFLFFPQDLLDGLELLQDYLEEVI